MRAPENKVLTVSSKVLEKIGWTAVLHTGASSSTRGEIEISSWRIDAATTESSGLHGHSERNRIMTAHFLLLKARNVLIKVCDGQRNQRDG